MEATSLLSRPSTSADAVDVVYAFSTLTWQAAARRGWFGSEDRLVRSLLASDRVGRLMICNHTRSLPRKLVRDLLERDGVRFPSDQRTRLVEPVRLRSRDPTTIAAALREFATYDRRLGRAARELGMENPVLITGHPLVAGLAELSWARSVTWYATDDWAAHPGYRSWWPLYRESYSRVRDSGRSVAAVSSVLLDRLDPTGPSTVVPNGLDPGEWMSTCSPPDWAPHLPRPLAVYAGSLDSRLEIRWLLELARDLPAATIVLVGPVADPQHLRQLAGVANIQLRGNLDRRRLTGLLRTADVGLLPHVRSPLTEAMSPLKLFEYLAAGLPVAASDLAPIRALRHPRVRLVDECGDYSAAVRAAAQLGRVSEPERIDFVEANSWRARHDQLLDLALA